MYWLIWMHYFHVYAIVENYTLLFILFSKLKIKIFIQNQFIFFFNYAWNY